MAGRSAAEISASYQGGGSGGTKLKDVVGKSFTIADFRQKHSSKYNSNFVLIAAVDENGEELELVGGGWMVALLQEIKDEGSLPASATVTSFPTERGTGYGLEFVEEG